MVPVLSTTRVFILCNFSKLSAFLIRIPFCAPFPTPTMIAVGVASPRAHGQAMTKMPTKESIPLVTASEKGRNCKPITSHISNVSTAITSTTGTNTPEIRSATFCIGARDPCASSTILIILARRVSPPIFVVFTRSTPCLFIVPPITLSPTTLSTGIGSPEIIDSSIEDLPSTITPSTGIFPPGFTMTISPSTTCSIGISTSVSPRTTSAVFACKFINFSIASPVFIFDRASKYFPNTTKPITTILTSK